MSADKDAALVIHGGTPVRRPDSPWPSWPVFDDRERTALIDVLESGEWFYGDRVARFEEEYASFQDARFGISCASGTAAIEVSLQALGVGPGDEVIVPPYTFIATASSVARCGAFPVFVDVDESWNMDPDLVEAAITDRTKAIMPVHFGGRICDMDRFNAIGAKHGIPILEDACHSWGGKWKGKGTGALGACGVFSFQMSKNITAGEGGIILTDDEELAARCRSVTNCGRTPGGAWYEHSIVGTNARMTEFQAAVLSAQLTRLEEQTVVREKNGVFLTEKLGTIEGIIPQPGDDRITRRAYHLYCVRIDPGTFGCSRESFCEAAEAEGVSFSTGYGLPLHRQDAFAALQNGPDYSQCRCPVAEDLCSTSGMWCVHQILLGSEQDMQDIVDIFLKTKKHAAELDN
jgi:dTDP-4-amino-4,6-dideoxygalactose transaminase